MHPDLQPQIARIEDLPYLSSPPMQFTFTQAAGLTLGQYVFDGAAAVVGNDKNITDNTLLFVKAVSFSADITLLNYQAALKLTGGTTNIPTFSLFLQSEARAPIFIDPIQLGNFFNDQEFKQVVLAKQDPNEMTGFFRGTLQQHGGLAGITEVNLTMDVWVQQITNDNFIAALRRNYPKD